LIKVINAKTISDAWFQVIYGIFDENREYSPDVYVQRIQKGSFEKEQFRLQYPALAISIERPDMDMVPVIPNGLGIPSPTTMEYIDDYFANYLMDPSLAENETYKYASRIHENTQVPHPSFPEHMCNTISQFERIVKMLMETPLTNQAVLEIAKPSDVFKCIGNDGKLDPPCLRLIDFKVLPKTRYMKGSEGVIQDIGPDLILTISIYFRSWDLWAGFPTNLGGLELLKQFVASECGLINGPMYAYSAGGHIYGYQEDIARIRTMKIKK
jgi:thymidylate synthase